MLQQPWMNPNRRTLICVDSYTDGILKGRYYPPESEGKPFDSLSQFLVSMAQDPDNEAMPQSYTELRSFSGTVTDPVMDTHSDIQLGKLATFELQVLFRQHSSWQGILHWREKGMEQSFRSVLELVILMDSALRA